MLTSTPQRASKISDLLRASYYRETQDYVRIYDRKIVGGLICSIRECLQNVVANDDDVTNDDGVKNENAVDTKIHPQCHAKSTAIFRWEKFVSTDRWAKTSRERIRLHVLALEPTAI